MMIHMQQERLDIKQALVCVCVCVCACVCMLAYKTSVSCFFCVCALVAACQYVYMWYYYVCGTIKIKYVFLLCAWCPVSERL